MQDARLCERTAMNELPFCTVMEARMRNQILPLCRSQFLPQLILLDVILELSAAQNMHRHIPPLFFLLSVLFTVLADSAQPKALPQLPHRRP